MTPLRLILLIIATAALTVITYKLIDGVEVDMKSAGAVAVFKQADVAGETTFTDVVGGCKVVANFTKLPAGLHGFHIHKAGDLRGEGCLGACAHYHKGPAASHGGAPGSGANSSLKNERQSGARHTGDLGNVEGPTFRRSYFLRGVSVADLLGRSLIVHADEDDLGLGDHKDSATTGNSGARIACVLIGRTMGCDEVAKTRKRRQQ